MAALRHFLLVTLGTALCIFNCTSQITITAQEEEPKDTVLHLKEDEQWDVEVFVLSNWSRTNRLLRTNEGLFGDTIGNRVNETYLDIWSYGIGFKSPINKYLAWEGGLSFIRNGESYKFSGADSSFSYKTRYSYIAMPIKIDFMYGKNFGVIASLGIVPQMFMSYQQNQHWITSLNATETREISSKGGYSSFVISAVANIGGYMRFNNRWILSFIPEYRIQLNSSYVTNDSFEHFARALGFNINLGIQL